MVPLSVDTVLKVAVERQELDEFLVEQVPEGAGGVSVSLDDLTLDGLVVKPDLKYLPSFLMLYAPPSEIKRMHNDVFPKRPDLKRARAGHDPNAGSCNDCNHGDGGACSKKEDTET